MTPGARAGEMAAGGFASRDRGMESEAEKYYRRKNRDRRFARWFVLLTLGLPLALIVGGIVGAALNP